MKKDLQKKQKGDGPLVSSRERTAAVGNHSSTGQRVPPFGLNMVSSVRASEEPSRTCVLGSWGDKKECFLGEPDRRRPVSQLGLTTRYA